MLSKQDYDFGVAWIANNDNPGDKEGVEQVQHYLTVLLLADLWGVDNDKVAADVIQYRKIARADDAWFKSRRK